MALTTYEINNIVPFCQHIYTYLGYKDCVDIWSEKQYNYIDEHGKNINFFMKKFVEFNRNVIMFYDSLDTEHKKRLVSWYNRTKDFTSIPLNLPD